MSPAKSKSKGRAVLAPQLMPVVIRQTCEIRPYCSHRAADESRRMKVRQVLLILKKDGWVEVSRRGSHRQMKHRSKPGRVTVPAKLSDELAPGTLNRILEQAGLKDE